MRLRLTVSDNQKMGRDDRHSALAGSGFEPSYDRQAWGKRVDEETRRQAWQDWGRRKPPKRKKQRTTVKSKRSRRYRSLVRRDGEVCVWCATTENLTVDHILPRSMGGSNKLENLQLLCQPCNQAKGDTWPQGVPFVAREPA